MPPSPELREQLIIDHFPQVKRVALKIHKSLTKSASLDELIYAGIIGLIKAIDHYDSRSNGDFKTYARLKISGAILSSLTGFDRSFSQQRARAKLIEAVISVLAQDVAKPGEKEIAAELRLSVSQYRDWLDATQKSMSGITEDLEPEIGRRNLLFDVAASEEQQSTEVANKTELARLVAEGIENMPALEQIVLRRFYDEKLTLGEIVRITNLSEVRVAQLRAQAVIRLRSYVSRKRYDWSPTEGEPAPTTLPSSNTTSVPRKTGRRRSVSSSVLPEDAQEELAETNADQYARSLIKNPIVQILMATASTFQEFETGERWLLTPSVALGNITPISLISSRAGREIVANELGLIEHGMF